MNWGKALNEGVGDAKQAMIPRMILDLLYNQPWRKYHNLDHVERVLANIAYLNQVYGMMPEQPRALLLAAVFHDGIYVPGRPGYETASALLLLSCFPEEEEAARLIRLTERHNPDREDTDGILLCDADLWDMSDETLAQANRQKLKDEYVAFQGSDQPKAELEADFEAGRALWIQKFLKRKHIFTGPAEVAEAETRQHLERELGQAR